MIRARWVTRTQAITIAATARAPGPTCSPSSRADQATVSSGWASWSWLRPGDSGQAEPAVPGGEAGEHRDARDVGEAEDGRRRRIRRTRAEQGDERDREGDGQRDEQAPGDHLPAGHLAREATALGVADAADGERREEEEVGRRDAAAAEGDRVADDRRAGSRAGRPEHPSGPLARPHHRGDGSRRRKQSDDDRRVGGRRVVEGERREQAEADPAAAGDGDQAGPGAPPGEAGPRRQQAGAADRGGHDRPAGADDVGIEAAQGERCRRERHREGEHAERREPIPSPRPRPGGEAISPGPV